MEEQARPVREALKNSFRRCFSIVRRLTTGDVSRRMDGFARVIVARTNGLSSDALFCSEFLFRRVEDAGRDQQRASSAERCALSLLSRRAVGQVLGYLVPLMSLCGTHELNCLVVFLSHCWKTGSGLWSRKGAESYEMRFGVFGVISKGLPQRTWSDVAAISVAQWRGCCCTKRRAGTSSPC